MSDDAYRKSDYHSYETSLAGMATNVSIPFGSLSEAIDVIICNDDSTNDFTVKFNGTNATTSPSVTVKAGEKLSLTSVSIKNIYLTNRTGSAINYRIQMWGS